MSLAAAARYTPVTQRARGKRSSIYIYLAVYNVVKFLSRSRSRGKLSHTRERARSYRIRYIILTFQGQSHAEPLPIYAQTHTRARDDDDDGIEKTFLTLRKHSLPLRLLAGSRECFIIYTREPNRDERRFERQPHCNTKRAQTSIAQRSNLRYLLSSRERIVTRQHV